MNEISTVEVLLTITSLVLRIYDVVSDIQVAEYYFSKGLYNYLYLTLGIILFSPFVSALWAFITYTNFHDYIEDPKRQRKGKKLWARMLHAAFAFSQWMDYKLHLKHLWNLLQNGKIKYKFFSKQTVDKELYNRSAAVTLYLLNFSRLIEIMIESLPQALLQIYILVEARFHNSAEEYAIIKEGWKKIVFCICSSLISYGFTVTGVYNCYAYGSAVFEFKTFTKSRILGLISHFVGQLLIMCCRVFILVLLAAENMIYFIVFLLIHVTATLTYTIVIDNIILKKPFSVTSNLAHISTLLDYLQLVETKFTSRFWGYRLVYFIVHNCIIVYCFLNNLLVLTEFYFIITVHTIAYGIGISCLLLHNFCYRCEEMGDEKFNLALKYIKPIIFKEKLPGNLEEEISSSITCTTSNNENIIPGSDSEEKEIPLLDTIINV